MNRNSKPPNLRGRRGEGGQRPFMDSEINGRGHRAHFD